MNKILTIVSIPHSGVAGSAKSASEITQAFENSNFNAFLMTNNRLPFLKNYSFTVITDVYVNNKISGYFTRGYKIHKFLIENKVDLIITLDKVSCYHASIVAALHNIPLVPIIPGGSSETVQYPPLNLRKTISFSEEIKDVLVNKWGFDPANILVRSNRFSFAKLVVENVSYGDSISICYISRLNSSKFSAFRFFIEEINKVKSVQLFKIVVAGDGIDADQFISYSRLSSHTIEFLGYKDITVSFLGEYDLIVTQGRGIIESVGHGICSSVCGESGYKGLINFLNFDNFKNSNFTGRGMVENSNLESDLKNLKSIAREDKIRLAKKVRDKYDVESMKNDILELVRNENLVPCNGSVLKVLFMNLKMFFKRI